MSFPIRKKNLISIVQSMKGFEQPEARLEQYITDATSTVDLLYYITVDNNDIVDNVILDLGAGTGRLGLTCLLLGAKIVVAVEKDANAIRILQENASNLELQPYIHILQKDLSQLLDIDKNEILEVLNKKNSDSKIICVMNPPFGVQVRNADRPFLKFAMEVSDKIYSIHLSNQKTRTYFHKFVDYHGWQISSIHSQTMYIEGSFSFHKKRQKEILADVYKFEKKEN